MIHPPPSPIRPNWRQCYQHAYFEYRIDRRCSDAKNKSGFENRKKQAFFSQQAVGPIGSYSSFFDLLLIATVLVYREIFCSVFDLVQKGLPGELVNHAFIGMMAVFALLFMVIPSVPIVKEITVTLKSKNLRVAWMLIFLIFVYGLALLFQLTYVYLDRFSSILT